MMMQMGAQRAAADGMQILIHVSGQECGKAVADSGLTVGRAQWRCCIMSEETMRRPRLVSRTFSAGSLNFAAARCAPSAVLPRLWSALVPAPAASLARPPADPACCNPGSRRRAGIKVRKLRPAVEGLTSAGSVFAELIFSLCNFAVAGCLFLALLPQQQGIPPIRPCDTP